MKSSDSFYFQSGVCVKTTRGTSGWEINSLISHPKVSSLAPKGRPRWTKQESKLGESGNSASQEESLGSLETHKKED